MSNVFYSDLDLTLIYSHRAIRKYHNTTYDSLVVEEHENKPLSYMKLEAWEKLVNGIEKNYIFIPTTTRTFEQYSRIKIPKVKIDYAITSNGGKIHKNGIEDKEWGEHIKNSINSYSLTPEFLFKEYENEFYKIPGVNKVRCAEGYFVYIVKDEAENHELEEKLKIFERENDYKISHQGKKSYIVPACLEKGFAIKYLNDKLNVEKSISAGDSRLDLSMSQQTKYFIQPKHGEGVGALPNAIITTATGSDSAVEILEIVNKKLR